MKYVSKRTITIMRRETAPARIPGPYSSSSEGGTMEADWVDMTEWRCGTC